jgi:hypothetical protein
MNRSKSNTGINLITYLKIQFESVKIFTYSLDILHECHSTFSASEYTIKIYASLTIARSWQITQPYPITLILLS